MRNYNVEMMDKVMNELVQESKNLLDKVIIDNFGSLEALADISPENLEMIKKTNDLFAKAEDLTKYTIGVYEDITDGQKKIMDKLDKLEMKLEMAN